MQDWDKNGIETRLYPAELLGMSVLDEWIPHLPVFDCGDNRTSIPVNGRTVEGMGKLGLMVSLVDPDSSKYKIEVYVPKLSSCLLPNSIGYRRAKPGRFAKFILDKKAQQLNDKLTAFDLGGVQVELSDEDVIDLMPHMISTVVNARVYLLNYGNQKSS